MHHAGVILAGLAGIEHYWFMILEMFFWNKPLGLKTFKQTQEHADSSKVLAFNQGLYNGFLATGVLWSLLFWHGAVALPIRTFFLGCIVVAGLVGGATVNPRVAVLQAGPAALAILFLWL